ncbi:MAG: SAM-dependent methyltransferase, partial [Actinomycetota bacterium]|nr:SAM-dependent methyltransferase [Actinomycetota bacterium]
SIVADSPRSRILPGMGDAPAQLENVRRRVVAAIAERGPITFAEYMELALYAPGGFYDAPPVGAAGHFVTSPHTHEVFARLLADGLSELRERVDRPGDLRVVEVGAGDGTLARQLLGHLAELPVDYTAVERSEGARALLSELPVTVTPDLREVGPIAGGCVIANELLDNLPFRRVRGSERGPLEIRVGLESSRLVEVETPCDAELAVLMLDELAPGSERAIPTGALAFVEDVAEVLVDGYAVLIDYEGGRNDLHGYRGHRVVEVDLDRPGTADITAGVDLDAVAARAERAGLHVFGTVSQSDALASLGYERWAIQEREHQGALLRGSSGLEAVRTWSSRNAAAELVDPAGLGRLNWLTLASVGRSAPSWTADREDGVPPS